MNVLPRNRAAERRRAWTYRAGVVFLVVAAVLAGQGMAGTGVPNVVLLVAAVVFVALLGGWAWMLGRVRR